MKRISARLFFTVMWRGLCQVAEGFMGLFGYKGEGRFAKWVWRVFATSATVIVTIFALCLVLAFGTDVYRWCKVHCGGDDQSFEFCDNEYCYADTYVNRGISFHNHDDGEGYVYNNRSRQVYLKHVAWIAKPLGNDSLVCFSDGRKRGYFSKNTGRVVIEPKYSHAWVFSDGLASVEEGGYIKFIDASGKVVLDKQIPYIPTRDGYVFHGGYCMVDSDDGVRHGLMDKTGEIVLPQEYDAIRPTNNFEFWCVEKGDEMAVLDKDMNIVVPMMEGTIYIYDGTINVTMPDHTLRKYDLQGELINDFYICSVRMLEYEKEEIKYEAAEFGDIDNTRVEMAPYHPKATARLRAYVAGDSYEGLMTADGHVVTMPLYKDIEAIDHDLYLCTSTDCDKVIVNGKGEIVK